MVPDDVQERASGSQPNVDSHEPHKDTRNKKGKHNAYRGPDVRSMQGAVRFERARRRVADQNRGFEFAKKKTLFALDQKIDGIQCSVDHDRAHGSRTIRPRDVQWYSRNITLLMHQRRCRTGLLINQLVHLDFLQNHLEEVPAPDLPSGTRVTIVPATLACTLEEANDDKYDPFHSGELEYEHEFEAPTYSELLASLKKCRSLIKPLKPVDRISPLRTFRYSIKELAANILGIPAGVFESSSEGLLRAYQIIATTTHGARGAFKVLNTPGPLRRSLASRLKGIAKKQLDLKSTFNPAAPWLPAQMPDLNYVSPDQIPRSNVLGFATNWAMNHNAHYEERQKQALLEQEKSRGNSNTKRIRKKVSKKSHHDPEMAPTQQGRFRRAMTMHPSTSKFWLLTGTTVCAKLAARNIPFLGPLDRLFTMLWDLELCARFNQLSVELIGGDLTSILIAPLTEEVLKAAHPLAAPAIGLIEDHAETGSFRPGLHTLFHCAVNAWTVKLTLDFVTSAITQRQCHTELSACAAIAVWIHSLANTWIAIREQPQPAQQAAPVPPPDLPQRPQIPLRRPGPVPQPDDLPTPRRHLTRAERAAYRDVHADTIQSGRAADATEFASWDGGELPSSPYFSRRASPEDPIVIAATEAYDEAAGMGRRQRAGSYGSFARTRTYRSDSFMLSMSDLQTAYVMMSGKMQELVTDNRNRVTAWMNAQPPIHRDPHLYSNPLRHNYGVEDEPAPWRQVDAAPDPLHPQEQQHDIEDVDALPALDEFTSRLRLFERLKDFQAAVLNSKIPLAKVFDSDHSALHQIKRQASEIPRTFERFNTKSNHYDRWKKHAIDFEKAMEKFYSTAPRIQAAEITKWTKITRSYKAGCISDLFGPGDCHANATVEKMLESSDIQGLQTPTEYADSVDTDCRPYQAPAALHAAETHPAAERREQLSGSSSWGSSWGQRVESFESDYAPVVPASSPPAKKKPFMMLQSIFPASIATAAASALTSVACKVLSVALPFIAHHSLADQFCTLEVFTDTYEQARARNPLLREANITEAENNAIIYNTLSGRALYHLEGPHHADRPKTIVVSSRDSAGTVRVPADPTSIRSVFSFLVSELTSHRKLVVHELTHFFNIKEAGINLANIASRRANAEDLVARGSLTELTLTSYVKTTIDIQLGHFNNAPFRATGTTSNEQLLAHSLATNQTCASNINPASQMAYDTNYFIVILQATRNHLNALAATPTSMDTTHDTTNKKHAATPSYSKLAIAANFLHANSSLRSTLQPFGLTAPRLFSLLLIQPIQETSSTLSTVALVFACLSKTLPFMLGFWNSLATSSARSPSSTRKSTRFCLVTSLITPESPAPTKTYLSAASAATSAPAKASTSSKPSSRMSRMMFPATWLSPWDSLRKILAPFSVLAMLSKQSSSRLRTSSTAASSQCPGSSREFPSSNAPPTSLATSNPGPWQQVITLRSKPTIKDDSSTSSPNSSVTSPPTTATQMQSNDSLCASHADKIAAATSRSKRLSKKASSAASHGPAPSTASSTPASPPSARSTGRGKRNNNSKTNLTTSE